MTKIAWTEFSYNPIIGCSKVSPGCAHCYAEKMARRLATMGRDEYEWVTLSKGGWSGNTTFVESQLNKPLKRKKPSIYFVCSMGDFWHKTVKEKWRQVVFDIVRRCPQHVFQFLTKRPENILFWPDDLPNAWLGVTAENQEMADERIPILLQIPAAVRFVSIEPMLESVRIKFEKYSGYEYRFLKKTTPVDWVIVGCESGPGRRPCNLEWIEDRQERLCLSSRLRLTAR